MKVIDHVEYTHGKLNVCPYLRQSKDNRLRETTDDTAMFLCC